MTVHVALQCCHVDVFLGYTPRTTVGVAWEDRRSQPAPTLFRNPTL